MPKLTIKQQAENAVRNFFIDHHGRITMKEWVRFVTSRPSLVGRYLGEAMVTLQREGYIVKHPVGEGYAWPEQMKELCVRTGGGWKVSQT